MDPVSVTAVVALLATFVQQVAGRTADDLADDVGADLADRLRRLYDTVRERLTGTPYAAGALERFESAPDDDRRIATLEDALAEVTEADPVFDAELTRLTGDALREAPPGLVAIRDSGAVAVNGQLRQSGKFVAGRDLTVQPHRSDS